MRNGLYNSLLIYQIQKHKSNQATNIKKGKPSYKGETKLMNNINDNKGPTHLQRPSTTTCTLLINHAVTPAPNLLIPNNDCMVMSKLNSFKLKEKFKKKQKKNKNTYNVIFFALSLFLHPLSPLNNCN